MLRTAMVMGMVLALAACSNFVPNEKKAVYDPETKQLTIRNLLATLQHLQPQRRVLI